MFSRSDKSDAPTEAVEPKPPTVKKDRKPMIMAGLAGLLALGGAFILAQRLGTTPDDAAIEAPVESTRQVLVVTQPIPAGTDVETILESPATYLAARAVPEQFAASSAVTSIEELEELRGLTLASEALDGEQLLRGRFTDRSDFRGDGLLERQVEIRIPEGHHTLVLDLPSNSALGGNLNGGELVSVISSFRVQPSGGEDFDLSVMVLPAVEVIAVQSTVGVVGQIASDVDQIGTATLGNLYVTLALTPEEITDVTYAMKYGDIVLAGALDGATNADPRPLTTMSTLMVEVAQNSTVPLEQILALLASDSDDNEGLDPEQEEDPYDLTGEGEPRGAAVAVPSLPTPDEPDTTTEDEPADN